MRVASRPVDVVGCDRGDVDDVCASIGERRLSGLVKDGDESKRGKIRGNRVGVEVAGPVGPLFFPEGVVDLGR